MIKVLVVEDRREKLQIIINALCAVSGIELSNIVSVMDAHNAKVQLQTNYFDVLVLDIAIPSRIDMEVERRGGTDLLDELFERDIYKVPSHIIGITAYTDILEEVGERFSRRLLTLIHFDPTSDEWENALKARIRHIATSPSNPQTHIEKYKSYLAVVCALDSPELLSILQLDWDWEQVTLPNDFSIYYKGTVNRNGKKEAVYAAASSRMGMPAASVLTMKIISAFRPQYLAMTGITAGVPGKTRLGDVIAADPSWDWGSGKWEMRNGELKFMSAPHQLNLHPSVRAKLKLMRNDATMLSRIRQLWPAESPEHELKLHIGPLASGASVLADGSVVEMIKAQHRELLGIEMETYGVFAAAEECPAPQPIVFSLKSVVDFADSNKDDRFRKYASFTSAQVLKHFVESYL